MTWEAAERVQKNDAGEYRAFIGGEWVPVAKAQKNDSGQFRVERIAEQPTQQETKPQPRIPEPSNPIDRAIVGFLSDKPKLTNALERNVGQASPFGRFVQGAADMPVGAMQLGMNAVGAGDVINPRIAEINARTEALRGPDAGFDFARLAGNLANPVPWAAGAKLPLAATLSGKVGQGAGVGALSALLSPVNNEDFWATKAQQGAVGGVLGGLIPLTAAGGQKVYEMGRNVIDPMLPGGLQRAGARLANTAAGDRRAAVINALENARDPVPGLRMNSGQAAAEAGSAEFSALQKLAAQHDPSDYFAQNTGQQQARVNALRTVGKTPKELESAISARTAEAVNNYGDAYQNVIKADPQLLEISKNPFVKESLADASRLAKANNINPKENLTEFLHLVKLSLDKQLSRTGDTALSNVEKRAVAEAKTELLEWIAKKNPDYEKARAIFAKQSAPINQMQVGQYLEDKLMTPIGVGERASSFAQAVKDAPTTIKRATTGGPRYENLSDVLEPGQVSTVNAVADSLKRDALYNSLAKTGRQAAEEIAGATQLPPTGAFAPLLSAARSWANKILRGSSDEVMAELGKQMQNPQQFAQLMKSVTPIQRKQIIDAMVKYQISPQAAIANQQQ